MGFFYVYVCVCVFVHATKQVPKSTIYYQSEDNSAEGQDLVQRFELAWA